MNRKNKHIAILFTILAFAFSKLGNCSMALPYYTLKISKQGSLTRRDTGPVNQKIIINKSLHAKSSFYNIS